MSARPSPGRRAALWLAAIALALAAPRATGATIREGRTATLPAPSGRLEWAAWTERGRSGRAVILALRVPGRAGGRPVWSTAWRDAYAPALRAVPGWRSRGRPLVALTLSYGAAAQEVLLFAAEGAGPPRQVAAHLASAIEWRAGPPGGTVLVAYERDASDAVPRCRNWNGSALVPVVCPG
ncbi:hypothetical protein VQH23_09165 [Pararoseomonas sp. SCSIO 73927]|uniref:hypothetical protein n=1 Tax=Pararoseomonas sp. SCSIO 73927 TaxID=3114537 RepID=UPI0030CAF3E4